MASTQLTRTPTAGNRRTWTYSTWIKRGTIDTELALFGARPGSGTYIEAMFDSAGKLTIWGAPSGFNLTTNRLFRDTSAWYHILFAVDTPQAVSSNRVKIYINGIQETSFSTETYPAQDYDTHMNYAYELQIGSYNDSIYFDGIMAHTHLADGLAYTPTVFGEIDSTSGIWVPISAPSVTYGTNGFFLKFVSGAFGTDSSGEGNTMTVTGTMTATKDNAMNNFATMNPLGGQTAATSNNSWSLAKGNLSFVSGNGYSQWITGTMSINAGKWYWELQPQGTFGTSDNVPYVGIIKTTEIGARQALTSTTSASNDTITMEANGDKIVLGTTSAGYGDTFTNDDKLMMAVDCDNGKVWWGVNGTWQKSGAVGDPANGTNANATFTAGIEFVPYCLGWSADATPINYNFGNGYFGTTAVASTNADDAGIGSFEYDVPTGFYTLCTNNLATYG